MVMEMEMERAEDAKVKVNSSCAWPRPQSAGRTRHNHIAGKRVLHRKRPEQGVGREAQRAPEPCSGRHQACLEQPTVGEGVGERRTGGGRPRAGGRAHGRYRSGLTPEREGKVKLALLLAAVGATLAVLSVGTEFWVELNTYKANGSAVCEAAHLGLWKVCTKRLWQADVPADRDTCGPAELPGEANCTYFKFFTTGENARIFQRTTKKEVNLAAAVIAVLGLVVMALGCLCIIMVLTKGAEFLLRVGAVCFGLSAFLFSPNTVLRPTQGLRVNPSFCSKQPLFRFEHD
ncbi:hypothetical protein H8959_006305 [Pygathrix nigripes]